MRSVRQAAVYALVGLLNTAVHFAIFEILLRVAGAPALVASTIGYCAGVINSYVLNRIWTFAVKTPPGTREFGRFALVNVLSLSLNLLVLRALITLGLSPEVSQIGAIGASLSANFVGSKWWAFRPAT
jgi:putative flippase GtrA